jgi:hypothetical protein
MQPQTTSSGNAATTCPRPVQVVCVHMNGLPSKRNLGDATKNKVRRTLAWYAGIYETRQWERQRMHCVGKSGSV